jgi:DNA polymerase elongation subunit (family B)
LFICFGNETRNNLNGAFIKGQEAKEKLNEILPSPIKMEFEKVLFPFIILTKKRYCGLVFEDHNDLTKSKILYKGISVVRRDFCAYTKHTLEEAMQIVFLERNIQKAYAYVQQSVKDLIEGRVPHEHLVMSKTLSSKNINQKNPAESTLAHVSLYTKLKRRDPNNCPKAGDRIEFLFVITGDKLL